MAKHVVVIAAGETERRSLPHLLAHLNSEGVFVDDVRIPPRNRALTVEIAAKLLKAAWYQSITPPDKFVVLVDTDGKPADDILKPFRDALASRLEENIVAALHFACARWHLEAWYFADIGNLRQYLGRAPGVDASQPDEIVNPKKHLKDLLGDRVYTAVVSEEIARGLDAAIIYQHSPSFRGFLEAARNGHDSISS